MKIAYLISSSADYTEPLKMLKSSMPRDIKRDVITVIGNSSAKGPIIHRDKSTTLWVEHNSFDYTALIEFVQREDLRKDYSHVFMLHDTMEFGDNTKDLIESANPDKLCTAVWGGQCNLYLLRVDYVLGNLDKILSLKNISKLGAITNEGFLYKSLPENLRESYNGTYEVLGKDTKYGGVERLVELYTGVNIKKYKSNWGQNMNKLEVRP